MERRLSRTRARVCLILMGIGLAAVLAGWTFAGVLVAWAGIAVFIVTMFVLSEHRCPHCGSTMYNTLNPQWSKPANVVCPSCKTPLKYDDEP